MFPFVGSACSIARALNAEIVQVPPLDSNRSDDFPGLIQAFSREAKKFIGTKAKQIDGESVTWLSQQHWSRNITQLRSVILDALICQSHSNASLQEILEEHYSLSEEHASLNREAQGTIDPLYAAQLLARNNLRYRITAAQLGCSVSTLLKTVYPSHSSLEH